MEVQVFFDYVRFGRKILCLNFNSCVVNVSLQKYKLLVSGETNNPSNCTLSSSLPDTFGTLCNLLTSLFLSEALLPHGQRVYMTVSFQDFMSFFHEANICGTPDAVSSVFECCRFTSAIITLQWHLNKQCNEGVYLPLDFFVCFLPAPALPLFLSLCITHTFAPNDLLTIVYFKDAYI